MHCPPKKKKKMAVVERWPLVEVRPYLIEITTGSFEIVLKIFGQN